MLEAYGRYYIVQFEAVAVSAAQDLLEIAPADDKPCLLVEAHVTQSSDYKDAEEEGLRIAVRRGYTTSGSLGTVPTIEKRNPGDAAASFAAEVNNTTLANTGTAVELPGKRSWNNRIGWHFEPTPTGYIWVAEAQSRLVVRLLAAPVDALTMDGEFHILELG
jgi:hypothetical protein